MQFSEKIKYYRVKFHNDENEIDRLKEEIRKLKATKKGGDFDDVNSKIRTVL